MQRFIYILISLSVLTGIYGCFRLCSEMGCAYQVNIDVRASDGSPVDTLTGTATVGEQSYVIACGDGVEPVSVDDNEAERINFCLEGVLSLPFPEGEEPSVQIALEGADGEGFEGTIQPSYATIEDFNGRGCGSCDYGEASITLQ